MQISLPERGLLWLKELSFDGDDSDAYQWLDGSILAGRRTVNAQDLGLFEGLFEDWDEEGEMRYRMLLSQKVLSLDPDWQQPITAFFPAKS